MTNLLNDSHAARLASETWRQLAGPYLADMLASPDNALALIQHPHADVRLAAMCICHHFWSLVREEAFVNACIELALSDSNAGNRRHAITILGRCFDGSRDLTFGRVLARLVSNQNEEHAVRVCALAALKRIDKGLAIHIALGSDPGDSVAHKLEIDWPLVDKYR